MKPAALRLLNRPSMKKYILSALIASSSIVAAQPAPPAPPPELASAPQASRAGAIFTVLATPRGDVDGVVLEDGTVIRFPPHAVVTPAALAKRASVKATGALVAGTLFEARVEVNGALVVDPKREPPRP